MRDGHNGYTASAGIASAREAAAADFTARGVPVSADRVLITSGTSEGIELALDAPSSTKATTCWCRRRPIRCIRRCSPRSAPTRSTTGPIRPSGWLPDLDHLARAVTPKTRALVVIDPNNPTGAVYPEAVRRQLVDFAESRGLVILADEVYGDLGFDGPVPPLAALAPEAAIISYSSLSKAYLAPGWRAGWMAVGATPRLDDALAAIKKLADGRLCSPGPMQYAVTAALTGDRSHQVAFRTALRERAALTATRFNAMPGMAVVAPQAAFYAMPQVTLPAGRTDEDFVLGLLRARGILCVHGSGFGLPADGGYFRVVFLASPAELGAIYDDVADYAREFQSRPDRPPAGPVSAGPGPAVSILAAPRRPDRRSPPSPTSPSRW